MKIPHQLIRLICINFLVGLLVTYLHRIAYGEDGFGFLLPLVVSQIASSIIFVK